MGGYIEDQSGKSRNLDQARRSTDANRFSADRKAKESKLARISARDAAYEGTRSILGQIPSE
jgi:hypothetical protein